MKKSFWSLAAGIFIVCLLLYWPSPHMGFVLDDHYVIAQNPVIKNPSQLGKIFTGGLFDAAHRSFDSKLNYYRPVLSASLAVDYRLWDLNAFGYRMVNLVFHAVNCILVFLFLELLFSNPGLASMAALVFCILPTHEWVVRYIVGRGDLLQAFFSLICFIAVLRSVDGRRGWAPVSWAAFVLAMLSREAAVINAAFIFLIAYFATRDLRRTMRVFAPFAVLAAGYYLLRLSAFPIVQGHLISGMGDGIRNAVLAVVHLWTPALVQAAFGHAEILATLIALGAVGLLIIQARRRLEEEGPVIGFAVVWIAVGVLPLIVTQRIVDRLGPVLSEHFLYMPSIGFAVLTAFLVENLKVAWIRKTTFVSAAVFFLSIGMINGSFWKSEEELLTHVQKLEGRDMTVAYEQLAMRYVDDEEAVVRLANAAPSASTRSLWLKRLGNIYHKRGDIPLAVEAFNEALRLNSNNIDAINELAVCYLETDDSTRGMELLERSIAFHSAQRDAWRIKGIAYYRWGRFNEAVVPLKEALRYDPDAKEPWLYLMMTYFFLHDDAAYLATVERLNRRICDEHELLKFAASELFSHGRMADVIKVLEPTRAMFAQDPAVLGLLAEAQRRSSGLPVGK